MILRTLLLIVIAVAVGIGLGFAGTILELGPSPAGNLKPSKKASTERIDGVVALIQAIDAMERNVQQPEYSVEVVG